jgi:hypothetical protein
MITLLWIVWHPGGGDDGPIDGRVFRASDAESAAQQWGHRFESHDCEYALESTPEIVIVCPLGDIYNQRKFRVRAQTSRDYFADELPW